MLRRSKKILFGLLLIPFIPLILWFKNRPQKKEVKGTTIKDDLKPEEFLRNPPKNVRPLPSKPIAYKPADPLSKLPIAKLMKKEPLINGSFRLTFSKKPDVSLRAMYINKLGQSKTAVTKGNNLFLYNPSNLVKVQPYQTSNPANIGVTQSIRL